MNFSNLSFLSGHGKVSFSPEELILFLRPVKAGTDFSLGAGPYVVIAANLRRTARSSVYVIANLYD
jgi:hypothetical protein